MIGLAREYDDLHYLKTPSQSSITNSKLSNSFVSEWSNSLPDKEKVWLYHRRLGHLTFVTIKILFPSLLESLHFEDFHCEFAKHKRVPLPIRNKRSNE